MAYKFIVPSLNHISLGTDISDVNMNFSSILIKKFLWLMFLYKIRKKDVFKSIYKIYSVPILLVIAFSIVRPQLLI